MDFQIIKAHLQQTDPVLYQVIAELELPPRDWNWTADDYFQRIAEDIIGQQLSVKVAEVITQRFRALFPAEKISPTAVLAMPDEQLRAIGLSWAKVKYVKDLADKTLAGLVQFEAFDTWDDETIIEHLTQVKGVGRWTAEMFLMFTLGRPDVFSAGDLGLKRAMQKVYGLSEQEVTQQAMSLAEKWAPYRTGACLFLWRTLDNQPG